ncbi:uncharacterized protein PAC_00089 [Phialocephala subalpina]|uniref:SGNH hydrolase-type esterase domain-containing protein n=1 Tax=Phialocephala subalpina TaxID=576137 RepID=A0A1L7WBQ2_9HELO|nr:uncharacterized protein PAC_00089 [Phialocephala subalpina]
MNLCLIFSSLGLLSASHSTITSNGVDLRILPLGDSITWGAGSSDGNGYRLDLQNLLSGNTVQYIGSQKSGSMTDNSNEGHPGAIISQIAQFANLSLNQLPNIVLLMAGTNDMNIPTDPATAPARLGSLIDEIVSAVPNTTVLVAQLIPAVKNSTKSNIDTFNSAIPGLVASRVSAGKKVLVIDLSQYISTSDLVDGIHPNDHGYSEMASAWYDGIQKAASTGWISPPQNVSSPIVGRGACSGSVQWNSRGLVATGVGSGDSAFTSGWTSFGQVAAGHVGTGSSQGSGVHLADINGDGFADYLWVDPTSGAVTAYLNGGIKSDGTSVWKSNGSIASGVGAGAGVVFADIDGDGYADYLWISTSGDVSAWINGKGVDSSGTYKWSSLGTIATGLGGTRDTIRFADIDGDGRADYIYVGPTGSLTAYLNYGSGTKPSWQNMGQIAAGLGFSDAPGVQLFDINNDGRADYLWVSPTGQVTAYINELGTQAKLSPNWTSAGVIATGVGAARANITFADLTGDGKADYVVVAEDTGALNVWVNNGTGGAFEAGDEVFFADINGDGKDDYLVLDPMGKTTAWFNEGEASHGSINWASQGIIATGVGKPRSQVHFADLNGDGLDDYLTVDPATGAVAMWQNGGGSDSNGVYKWSSLGTIAAGVGPGAGVRFADFDGDGKDDYLWVDVNGAASLWLNGGQGSDGNWIWNSKGKIATGVGASREDVHFADIDGDGKVDYLWVDRLSGETRMLKNGGEGGDGNWIWTFKGEIATGVGTNGAVVRFADLSGSGRSDYLNVVPWSSGVTMWENGCSDGGSSSSKTATVTPTATATGTGNSSPTTPTTTTSSAAGGTGTGKPKSGAENLHALSVTNLGFMALGVVIIMW